MCYFISQILADNQQIKSDLFLTVFKYTILDLFLSQLNPFIFSFIFSYENGTRLEPIKFVQISFERDITHKVINIRFFLWFFVLFENKRFWATKTIVYFSDVIRVWQNKTSVFTTERSCKLFVLFQSSSHFNRSIEKNGKNSLSGASVIDYLSSEKQLFVIHCESFSWFNAFSPLEQENKPIYFWLQCCYQGIILHAVDFLHLSRRNS